MRIVGFGRLAVFGVMLASGCGSVAAGPGNDGGALTDASGGSGGADAPGGSGGGTGGSGGATGGSGGATGGTGGGGGSSCTGAGVCGRGPTGIYCAQSDGASALVDWKQWTAEYTDVGGWKATPAYWATIQFPDLNGDGGADICGRASAGIYCGLSTGAGFAAPRVWSSNFTDAGGWNASPSYWGTIQFPDVNGDGRADVCGRSGGGIICAVSNGSDGFGPTASWDTRLSDASNWTAQRYWGTIQFPDVNGDGKDDLCARGGAGIYCALSNGATSFGTLTIWQADYSDAAGWGTSASFWGTIQFPDLNGDGSADVCGRASDGIVCAISNATNGFGPTSLWAADFSNTNAWDTLQSYWGTIQFPDLDGDGRADVCARGSDGLRCGLSTGSGFAASTLWTAALANTEGFTANATTWGTIGYPDLNADGKADVCARGPAGVLCALSSGSAFAPTLWADQMSDENGWGTDLSYGATMQTPVLNGTGCRSVTKGSTYVAPLARRMPPF